MVLSNIGLLKIALQFFWWYYGFLKLANREDSMAHKAKMHVNPDQVVAEFIKKTKSNPTSIKEFLEFSVAQSLLETYNKNTNQIELPDTEDKYLEKIAIVYIFGKKCMTLGSGLCYDQTKWDNGLQCRTCCTTVLACFSHPNCEQYWSDIEDCGRLALASAGLAALLSGGSAAVAAFKTAFYGCIMQKLGDWASQIQIDIRLTEECGNWRWCM